MARLLETWSRAHALVVLVALGAALFTRNALPLSITVLVSVAALVFIARGRWSPQRRFGAANWVTSLRLGLAAALPSWAMTSPPSVLAALCFLVFALDGVDGWLATRFGTKSEFGARFDMETDAGFVLIVELVLFLHHEMGAWILITGLLRYVYVLVVALVPPRGSEVERSRFGRLAFSCLVLGLVGAFALPRAYGTALAIFGTAAVSASFARSFQAAYSPRSGAAARPGA